MRARHLSTRAAVLLVLLLLVSACRGGAATPEPTGPPPPEPADPADPADPEPVTLRITHIEMAPMGNGEILVGTGETADADTAEAAVESTRAALERYLNAQFIDPATRFTDAPARALLQPGVFDALPPEQRAALGVRYLPASGVVAGSASGTASVLFERRRAYAVAIEYRLELDLHFPAPATPSASPGEATPTETPTGYAQPLVQYGTVLFTAPGWGVESFDVRTDGPDVPSPAPSPPPTAPPAEVAS